MKNIDFKEGIIPINLYTHKELLRYKHEILFYVTESLEASADVIVQETLLLISDEELFTHLEHHQKMLFTYCKLQNIEQLTNFIVWSLRVFYYKDIDLQFLKIEFETWEKAHKKYLSKVKFKEIEILYSYILKNFEFFVTQALEPIEKNSNKTVDALYKYSINADLNSAINLCEPFCDSIETFNDFFFKIVSKTMHKIGKMWEIGEIDVAKEHISSSLIEELCLHFIEKFEKKGDKQPIILIATSPNESHALGIKIIANTLKKIGYKVVNVGANPQIEGLVSAIGTFKVDYLALSVTLPINIPIIIDLIKQIRNIPQYDNLKIIVGGYGFENLENPAKLVGAEFYSKDINKIIQFINESST